MCFPLRQRHYRANYVDETRVYCTREVAARNAENEGPSTRNGATLDQVTSRADYEKVNRISLDVRSTFR